MGKSVVAEFGCVMEEEEVLCGDRILIGLDMVLAWERVVGFLITLGVY